MTDANYSYGLCGQCNSPAIGTCGDCHVDYCRTHSVKHTERPCTFGKPMTDAKEQEASLEKLSELALERELTIYGGGTAVISGIRMTFVGEAELIALLTDLRETREALRDEVALLSRPKGLHRYNKGGIHESDCAACALLSRLRANLERVAGKE